MLFSISFQAWIALLKQMSPSSREPYYTPPSVTSDTKTLSIFMECTWQHLTVAVHLSSQVPLSCEQTSDDRKRHDEGGSSEQTAMGASEMNCLACYGQQVKHIHSGLRKIAIFWRGIGEGAPAFAYPTSEILFIKGNTAILLAACQAPQVWLFSLLAPLICSSFFSFPIHCLSSCSFACASARNLSAFWFSGLFSTPCASVEDAEMKEMYDVHRSLMWPSERKGRK